LERERRREGTEQREREREKRGLETRGDRTTQNGETMNKRERREEREKTRELYAMGASGKERSDELAPRVALRPLTASVPLHTYEWLRQQDHLQT